MFSSSVDISMSSKHFNVTCGYTTFWGCIKYHRWIIQCHQCILQYHEYTLQYHRWTYNCANLEGALAIPWIFLTSNAHIGDNPSSPDMPLLYVYMLKCPWVAIKCPRGQDECCGLTGLIHRTWIHRSTVHATFLIKGWWLQTVYIGSDLCYPLPRGNQGHTVSITQF